MATFNFELGHLPPEAEKVREEVRDFLRVELALLPADQRARSWGGFNLEFSRKMGARGWIGMTWPRAYGGHEKSALERYVVLEETLAAGAPVSAHWAGRPAERAHAAPLRHRGTAPALPAPDRAGRAGLRHRDERAGLGLGPRLGAHPRREGARGYWVTGTKIWTSNAHISDYAIALFWTRVVPDKKHEGLSQFLVDLKSPGISIRPILDLSGGHHFNEVHFEDCFVPDDLASAGRRGLEAGHHDSASSGAVPSATSRRSSSSSS